MLIRSSSIVTNAVSRRSCLLCRSGTSTAPAPIAVRFKSAVAPALDVAARSAAPSSSATSHEDMIMDTMALLERIPKRKPARAPASPPRTVVDARNKNVDIGYVEPSQAVAEEEVQPEERTHVTYTDGMVLPLTSRLHLHIPKEGTSAPNPWPVYRLMEESGHLRQDHQDQDQQDGVLLAQESVTVALRENEFLLQKKLFTKAYHTMIRLRQMDEIMMSVQRQGRVSFYMSAQGEEAIHMGVASALREDDVVLAQYREQGVLLWRGFSLEQMAHQCFSTDQDLGKGRQMPVHYGSRELHFHTISSPLGTQLPQAVGVAYKLKLDNKNGMGTSSNAGSDDRKKHSPRCAVTFFGEGAASTGDFHTACNMAATLETPLLLICRNNGYAISTSTHEQYRGDGIISRAPGYGIAAIRVDGNDLLAVHSAIQRARAYALANNAPVMVECMTYRQSHHSTSDDSTAYRSKEEVQSWATDHGVDPLNRLLNYMIVQKQKHSQRSDNDGVASLSREQATKLVMDEHARLCQEERKEVLKALDIAEHCPKPTVDTMFEDVYKTKPPCLIRQEQELMEHVQRHPEVYEQENVA